MTETAVYQTDTSDMLIPHGLFRSALTAAPDLVRNLRPGDIERCGAVSSYTDNVLRFLDAHHGGEDELLWPVLQARCPLDAGLIARMEGQHETIHELRNRIDPLLRSWSETADPETGARLAGALESLRRELEVHFGEEEAEILPLASRNVSQEEWGALPGHAMGHFTGDKMWLVLGLVFEQMSDAQRAVTMKHLPPSVVDMWTSSGRAAFDAFMAQVRSAAA